MLESFIKIAGYFTFLPLVFMQIRRESVFCHKCPVDRRKKQTFSKIIDDSTENMVGYSVRDVGSKIIRDRIIFLDSFQQSPKDVIIPIRLKMFQPQIYSKIRSKL